MNFKNVVESISDVKYETKQINISSWAQYKVEKGKIHHLNPTTELSDNEEIIIAMYNISSAIDRNVRKYRQNYDELHGEGAYNRLYYLEPIYPNLDVELDAELEIKYKKEKEKEKEIYEEDFYEQNTHCY